MMSRDDMGCAVPSGDIGECAVATTPGRGRQITPIVRRLDIHPLICSVQSSGEIPDGIGIIVRIDAEVVMHVRKDDRYIIECMLFSKHD